MSSHPVGDSRVPDPARPRPKSRIVFSRTNPRLQPFTPARPNSPLWGGEPVVGHLPTDSWPTGVRHQFTIVSQPTQDGPGPIGPSSANGLNDRSRRTSAVNSGPTELRGHLRPRGCPLRRVGEHARAGTPNPRRSDPTDGLSSQRQGQQPTSVVRRCCTKGEGGEHLELVYLCGSGLSDRSADSPQPSPHCQIHCHTDRS